MESGSMMSPEAQEEMELETTHAKERLTNPTGSDLTDMMDRQRQEKLDMYARHKSEKKG